MHDGARKAVQALETLRLPLGWQAAPFKPIDWVPAGRTWSSGPALLKLFGCLLTALAGTQGAPFWFDILRKLSQKK